MGQTLLPFDINCSCGATIHVNLATLDSAWGQRNVVLCKCGKEHDQLWPVRDIQIE